MPRRPLAAAALVALLALAACGGGAGAPSATPAAPAPAPYTPTTPLPGAVTVAFSLPRGDAAQPFLELPWPSDLLRRADGRPDFRAFPGGDTLIFGAYVSAAVDDAEGYSVSPTVYFHFTGPLGDLRLPEGPRGLASARSPVFLVDVDPRSPERGTFHPLEHRHYRGALRFVPADTLAVKPLAGVVLRAGTLYAAVVQRDLGGPGADLGTPMDLEIVKWTSRRDDPREEAARALHAGALDTLAELGVGRDRIAGLAVFRTQVPHAVTARLLDAVIRLPPARSPRVVRAAWADHLGSVTARAPYQAIEGIYCTPSFQSGIENAPYLAEDGGHIERDPSGEPRLAEVPAGGRYGSGECGGLLRARFVLTVPAGPMPPQGFPLMVSAHGTGGDAQSFLGEDDFAGWAARQGIAVVSTDQPLHGGRGPAPRPGSREPISISIAGLPLPLVGGRAVEAAFYNPIHPLAARDNLRQAAVDAMVLARLFSSTDFATARGADGAPVLAAAAGRAAPRFDRARVLAAGHSQGCQSVAVMGAVDPLVKGVILSGCGGDTRLGVLHRKDLPIVPLVGTLLGLAEGELDEMHPFMSLVQTLADPIDPQSYARLYWEPLPGRRPQSVLHYEGMTDTFAPPVTAEALATALRATHLSPVVRAVPGLGGREGLLADLLGKGGPVRAFAQFRSTRGENGHFVIYREPGAADLAMEFMKAAVR